MLPFNIMHKFALNWPVAVVIAMTATSTISIAQQPAATVEDGQLLVQKHCARCHAVDVKDTSKHREAPAFRDVLKRYNASVLGEALAEGMLTGHPDMPEFIFQASDAAAIIKYLNALSEK
jgi:mono/diheme cytochrome c family protein